MLSASSKNRPSAEDDYRSSQRTASLAQSRKLGSNVPDDVPERSDLEEDLNIDRRYQDEEYRPAEVDFNRYAYRPQPSSYEQRRETSQGRDYHGLRTNSVVQPQYRPQSSTQRLTSSVAINNINDNFLRMSISNRLYAEESGPTSAGVVPEETRDRIIQTYRDEIKSLQARERDYKTLQEVIAELHRRFRTAESEVA